ncbi:MAG: hypothetical protein VX762_01900 [Bacteroidota bacterium]|nr:hypothetical protein [Bacteroidota bacterium]
MLSKTHETTFQIPIKYINYPADLVEVIEPSDFVQVRVKAAGISIISFHLFNYNSLILNYDVANSQPITNGKNLFWIMNSKRKEVADVLGGSIEIMDITPERLIVPFANKTNKEVPVILNADINLKQAFWLANDIKITPSSVILYGEQDLLDSISSVTTNLLKLNELDKDQVHEIALVLPNGLKCKTHAVSVKLNVDPFVEEVVTQEVEIRNLDKGYSMKLFPRNVSVTLRLSKDKYQLLKTNFLRLYIDASKLGEQKTIPIEYDNLPEMVKLERIYPNRLEFFLIKE